MESIARLTERAVYPDSFGARVFKVSRDDQGQRLTHLKVTGGRLQVRDAVSNGDWEEKVNQIRIYSGERFHSVDFAEAGSVCAVTGLSLALPGDGLGLEAGSLRPVLKPVLSTKYPCLKGKILDCSCPNSASWKKRYLNCRLSGMNGCRKYRCRLWGRCRLRYCRA